MRDRELWSGEGFSDVFHYAQVVADLSAKTTRDLLRVADDLRGLEKIAKAYASGEIPFSKVREIVRVATPRNEEAWIEEARQRSCRAIEDLVARAAHGDTPQDARARRAGEGMGRESVPFVLHLRPEVHAVLTEAIDACRRMAGGRSLEEAIVAFAEIILGNDEAQRVSQAKCMSAIEPERDDTGRPNPTLEGAHRAPFQVVVYRCEACGGAKVHPSGVAPTEELLERAECDADVVDLTAQGRLGRTIPPRVRRAVVLRDGGRCQAPGCVYRLWTDCHHVLRRSKGGGHDPANLVVLCTVHHEAVHHGDLIVQREGAEWRWRHRDGREFGAPAPEALLASHVGRRAAIPAALHVS